MSRKTRHVDYYEVLGVARNASDEDIKRGYKKQALRWHPDKNPGNIQEAAENFKLVSEAYQVLSDKRRREIYDSSGCNVGEAETFSDEDIAAAAAAFDLNAFRSPADIYRQFFPEDTFFADLLESMDYQYKQEDRRRSDPSGNLFNGGPSTNFAFDYNELLRPNSELYDQLFGSASAGGKGRKANKAAPANSKKGNHDSWIGKLYSWRWYISFAVLIPVLRWLVSRRLTSTSV